MYMKLNPAFLLVATALLLEGQTDPGVRRVPPQPPQAIAGATAAEMAAFLTGKSTFEEVDDVAKGLGPRFNLDGCAGCHSQPTTGGTAPAINPQIAMATAMGGQNRIPAFLSQDGPVRVVRTRNGGGVLNLFVITGRGDAPEGCRIEQPDFTRQQGLVFRIPTPVFGLGLVESISDSALRGNLASTQQRRQGLGIRGQFNTNGNDGTITRFGWKAQNKSLAIFSGEAYNVEVGVTNPLFPQEREEDPACQSTQSPEDHPKLDSGEPADIDHFTTFMRFLAPTRPGPPNASVTRGGALFDATGCAVCHTPTLTTSPSSTDALSEKPVRLFSDLALHDMGQGLSDGITQGNARGNDWRTAPLWGLGDRIFLLHDGRTKDLVEAIRAHDGPGSEARQVIQNFNALPADAKQDLLNFLRSL